MDKHTRTAPITFVFFITCLFSSCAISRALYLGTDRSPLGTEFTLSGGATEDINGVFPDAVYIKTRTQTFNAYHYYILHDGLIWYKSIEADKEPKDWTLFEKAGLPHNNRKRGFRKPEKIAELSADADELVALSVNGAFYRYCFDATIAHASNVWADRQGWPREEQLFFDPETARNRAWAMGKRNAQVLYYEDPFGNQHHNGTMEIATTYVLMEDGQEIRYADAGLPSDFSRNYIGPERGAFKAASLSASASTMFVLNEAGEMYTRLADFDTLGCDPMWFKYTYKPYTSDVPGTNYFSNLTEWALPAEDWLAQPPVPLNEKAAITRHITILQNGQGNGARELRVAGWNERGEAGYWTKAIFADAWDFVTAPLFLSEGDALNGNAERGQTVDKTYSGRSWNGIAKAQDIGTTPPLGAAKYDWITTHDWTEETQWFYEITNFNILEGDCNLNITWRGETCTLTLHPVEMWSYLKRDYMSGRTGAPKVCWVTLVIPDGALNGLSPEFAVKITERFAPFDKKIFHYTLAATAHFILMRDSENTASVLYLTDGTISNRYNDFQQQWFVENYAEATQINASELLVDERCPVTGEELSQKITANKIFRDDLKHIIRQSKWSRLTAFKFNFGYIPAHYIITPLRFVDVPKIRTITTYGDRIVLSNSAFTTVIAELRVALDERLLELLNARIKRYEKLARELSKEKSGA
ncbi:MAG: hypothetical protein LBB61_06475 [Treponema sp.]|jgi:hypothetical protein|nr:hypothetical protein [Treponema sp.]